MKKPAKKIKENVQTDYGAFAVVLEVTPDTGGYMVTVPRMPPVITWGKTISHAKEMAKEAIEVTIEARILMDAERAGKIKTVRSLSNRSLALA